MPKPTKKKFPYRLAVGEFFAQKLSKDHPRMIQLINDRGQTIWEIEQDTKGHLSIRLCNADTQLGYNSPAIAIHPIVGNSLRLEQQVEA